MSKQPTLFMSKNLLARISDSQKMLSDNGEIHPSQRNQLQALLSDLATAVCAYDRSFMEHSDNVQVAIAQAFDSCAYLARTWPSRQVLNEQEMRIAKFVAESISEEVKSHAFE